MEKTTPPDSLPRLTAYSHGAGCGCKISPKILDEILKGNQAFPARGGALLVGNDAKDDAAVYDLGGGQALISTTDFFMPIVDDPFDFGRIAAANAISDVYAMGGRPVLALAILGWPVDRLAPEVAGQVVAGARAVCQATGAALAGGHSIDSPEPIFGLAVNGLVGVDRIKRNSGARPGDLLFLTKPLGIGILTTAEKKNLLRPEHRGLAVDTMLRLNSVGERLGALDAVHALTDVTGFGLLGHLSSLCAASGVSARLRAADVPLLTDLAFYLDQGAVPGGTKRNFDSYGNKIAGLSDRAKLILCDPQTSGGLLVACDPAGIGGLEAVFAQFDLGAFTRPIGEIAAGRPDGYLVECV